MNLPFGPIEQRCKVDDQILAERLGCSRRSIVRYRHTGLTVRAAERFAHRLGLHPVELWPEYGRA